MFKRKTPPEGTAEDTIEVTIDTNVNYNNTDNTDNTDSNTDNTDNKMDEVNAKLELLIAKLTVSEQRQNESEDRIKSLTENLNRFQSIETPLPYNNIETTLTSGEEIQLDAYKAIPEFSGDQKNYRSWREQVVRRMSLIENYKGHPKYEAALGIIRAKITGTPSEILINNDTKYNIDAIIDRLDFSYADQRPLYVIEAEMTMIHQGGKTLQEFYDNINRALNMVITKIVMTYKSKEEQKSITEQMQQKAIRTFIIGLKSATTRSILYGQSPKSLSTAFAIAQTVFYDSQHLQLERRNEPQRNQTNFQQNNPFKYNPNFNYNKQQQSQKEKEFKKSGPMEVDNSNRFRQSNVQKFDSRQQNLINQGNGQKREYETSRQQPNKFQRINKLQNDEDEPAEGNLAEEDGIIPDDLISNSSHISTAASAFLAE